MFGGILWIVFVCYNGKFNLKVFEEVCWFIGSNGNSCDGKNIIIGEVDCVFDVSLDVVGFFDLDEVVDEVGFFFGINLMMFG